MSAPAENPQATTGYTKKYSRLLLDTQTNYWHRQGSKLSPHREEEREPAVLPPTLRPHVETEEADVVWIRRFGKGRELFGGNALNKREGEAVRNITP